MLLKGYSKARNHRARRRRGSHLDGVSQYSNTVVVFVSSKSPSQTLRAQEDAWPHGAKTVLERAVRAGPCLNSNAPCCSFLGSHGPATWEPAVLSLTLRWMVRLCLAAAACGHCGLANYQPCSSCVVERVVGRRPVALCLLFEVELLEPILRVAVRRHACACGGCLCVYFEGARSASGGKVDGGSVVLRNSPSGHRPTILCRPWSVIASPGGEGRTLNRIGSYAFDSRCAHRHPRPGSPSAAGRAARVSYSSAAVASSAMSKRGEPTSWSRSTAWRGRSATRATGRARRRGRRSAACPAPPRSPRAQNGSYQQGRRARSWRERAARASAGEVRWFVGRVGRSRGGELSEHQRARGVQACERSGPAALGPHEAACAV